MTTFFLFQFGILVFAIASAVEEAAFTYPFRELSNEQFNFETKFKKSRIAHGAGAVGVLALLVMIAAVQFLQSTNPGFWIRALAGITAAFACGLIYWFAFNLIYNQQINQRAFFLGTTAATDIFLQKTLGKKAGLKTALFCLVGIIAINLTYKTLT